MPRLIGFVSEENFQALSDVQVEFLKGGCPQALTRSTPSGAVYADLEPGTFEVVLTKSGFGSKRSCVTVDQDSKPHHFRLLSDGLLGYAWPKWNREGGQSELRVHSVEPYRVSLWRYGWKKDLVQVIGWYDEHGPRSVSQITPDGDYSQTGTEWNRGAYGEPDPTSLVAAPAPSSLYYFHLEGESGRFFACPWVIAPATPRFPLAVLASTNTWNAYNNFGGRSNYINAAGLPPRPTVYARTDLSRYTEGGFSEWRPRDDDYPPLSFDRPEPGNTLAPDTEITDPVRGRLQCALAPAEWRFLGWLEKQGYSYDLYSDFHLHSGELPLSAYSALALAVHPEYWSRQMYFRVKEWVAEEAGGLIYLGGNGLNCEVELSEASSMRCKTHLASEGGSLGMWAPDTPDVWLESRFHRTVESEASLLGVVCSESGIMTAAPYRVLDSSHWIFNGTELKEGDCFGKQSQHERCPGGASGHETDKTSRSTPAGIRVLAKGTNPQEGGAEMVSFDLGRGRVFSAGSISYVHSLLVDETVSKITTNVLTQFLSSKSR